MNLSHKKIWYIAIPGILLVWILCFVSHLGTNDRKNIAKAPLGSFSSTMWPDLIVFSYDRPLQLYGFLESLEKYASHVGQIKIITRASSDSVRRGYEEVGKRFKDVEFMFQSSCPQQDFKPLVLEALNKTPSSYVLFAVDDVVMTDYVDLEECARALKETDAWGFFLRLGKNIRYCYMEAVETIVPPLTTFGTDIFQWTFKEAKGDWSYSNSLDMTLYDKQKISKDMKKMDFVHPNSLESKWNLRAKKTRSGLCYARSKMVNVPLNLVNLSSNRHMHSFSVDELLQKFIDGWKMDISQLHLVDNSSPHMEYEPLFIKRNESEHTALRNTHE